MRNLVRNATIAFASLGVSGSILAACPDAPLASNLTTTQGAFQALTLFNGDEAAACGGHAAPILAGQTIAAGTAVISNTNDAIQIDVSGNADWSFQKVHVYVGTTPPDSVAPGRFPYQQGFDAPVGSYSLTVPFGDIGAVGCGETIYVAVHTESVKLDGAGNIVASETGWAFGTPFEGARWGWFVEYALCCAPESEDTGCTLTQGYWKNHNAFAKVKKNRRDWPMPEDENNLLCGRSWLTILQTPPAGGDAWMILAHQFIAARLNVANGASVPTRVADALADGESLLVNGCMGIATADRDFAIANAGILDAYNNGLVGPGHCE